MSTTIRSYLILLFFLMTSGVTLRFASADGEMLPADTVLPAPDALVQQVMQATQDPELKAQMEAIQRLDEIRKDPRLAGYFRLVTQPEFLKNVQTLATSTDWKKVFYVEIAFFLFIAFIRAFLQSRLDHGQWIARLWISVWTAAALWMGVFIVLPTLILGSAYASVLKGVYQAFTGTV